MNVFVAVTSANPRSREHVAPLNTLSLSTARASVMKAEDEVNVQRSIRMNGRVVGNSCAQSTALFP